MTNGSGPHPAPGGKKKGNGKNSSGRRKPAAEILTKRVKQKAGPREKGTGG